MKGRLRAKRAEWTIASEGRAGVIENEVTSYDLWGECDNNMCYVEAM